MHVKENAYQIILTDRAGCVWLFASFFMFVGGVILYGSMGGFTNWHETPAWVLAVSAIMGFIGIITGLYIVTSTPFCKVTLNKNTRTVLYRRRGLLKTEERMFRFSEIAEFFVSAEKDHEGDMYYRVDLRFKTGEEIRLSEVMDPLSEANEQLAVRLNTFIC